MSRAPSIETLLKRERSMRRRALADLDAALGREKLWRSRAERAEQERDDWRLRFDRLLKITEEKAAEANAASTTTNR